MSSILPPSRQAANRPLACTAAVVALASCLLFVPRSVSAQQTALPPELATLNEQFLKLQAERVTTPFEAALTQLNTSYFGGIDKAIAAEKAAANLDGIMALEAKKKLFTEKKPLLTAMTKKRLSQ